MKLTKIEMKFIIDCLTAVFNSDGIGVTDKHIADSILNKIAHNNRLMTVEDIRFILMCIYAVCKGSDEDSVKRLGTEIVFRLTTAIRCNGGWEKLKERIG